MDKKVFLENLMTYIKENMNEENVRFFKKSIKFRKVNHLYGEIFFEHSRNFEGCHPTIPSSRGPVLKLSFPKSWQIDRLNTPLLLSEITFI